MGIPIPVEAKLDTRSATAAANRAERVFADAGRDAGKAFTGAFDIGDVEKDLKKIGDKASDAYDRSRDAVGKLRAEEEKLQSLRERGARNDQVVAQAERVEKARRAEVRAIRDATNAYEEYERAAESAGQQGGQNFLSGLSGADAGGAGQGMADEFAGGFASSTALMRLGAAGGPLGLALAGVATLGVLAGRELAQGISDGMATLQMRDVFQGRMGLDEASMAQYATAAGAAFANNWGASVADNLATAQVALQSGIIDTHATDAQVQTVIEQLQGMAMITDATTAELSRSITTMMRTGMAGSVAEASDIIVAGFQNGLNVSGDWLDTINEYSTQFRKLGLDAGQVLTLLSQGMEGGARDTDKVADSLKEFSIRAVDGSKTTREGFEALGFSADEMGRLFAAGGDSASVALGSVLSALRDIEDPMQQALIWQRLFGTQFEDMGDAINQFDLDPMKNEFRDIAGVSAESTATATDNWLAQWDSAIRSAEMMFSDFSVWLADAFVNLPIVNQLPEWLNTALDVLSPPTPGPAGPSGPAPAGYTPTSPLPAMPATPQGPGIGPVPVTSAVDDVLGALLPTAPAAPTVPAAPAPAPDMEWDWRTGGLVPAATPRPSSGPTRGPRVPILTDAQAEAAKEAEKAAASGGSASLSASRSPSTSAAAPRPQVTVADFGTSARTDLQNMTGEIGAALDRDFGISKGLPGIVENLIRTAASFAAAPIVGPLSAIANANPNEGSGLMGMLAANGAFGSQYTSSAGAASPTGGAPLIAGAGSNVDAMMALAQRSSGGRYVFGGSDLANGLSDCSGAVSDLVEILTTGQTTPGRLFSTGDAAQVLAGLGFQQGFMPGALNIGFKNGGPGGGHMAATLPNGVAFESGGGTGQGATYGGPAVGANDPQFTDRWFLPVGGGGFGGGGSVSSPISSASGGTVPVFVVNMPGGGGFPAALAPGAPTSPGSAPAAPGADPGGYLNSNIAPGSASSPGLYSPENTNPGLNNPAAPGAPLPPLGSLPGSGGPLGLPGVGMPGSAGMGGLGGQSYPGQGGGEGGIGLGGMALDGIMAATSGLDMMAPGAGAAAKVGIQVANRAAKYAGQVGGIAVGGILDTLTPAGDNPKASIGNSWFGKIAGGIASAAPALPNMAGKKAAPPNPNDPNGQGGQGQGGNTINQHLTLNNNHATEDVQGNQAVREMGAMFTP